MTETIEAKFEEPSRDNVEIGDVVVTGRNYGDWIDAPTNFYPIIGIGEKSLFYKGPNVNQSLFDSCLILRRDGTYLIGKNVQRRIKFYEEK